MDTNMLVLFTLMAAEYNCSTYGSGDYNSDGTCQTETTPGDTNTGGQLVETGAPYFVSLAAGVLLVAIALGVIVSRIVRRRRSTNR